MTLSKKIQAAVLIVLNFLLLHYIVSSLPLRFDFTEEGIYTLSDSTRNMLEKLEEPVSVDFYSSKSIADLPAWFKNFSDRVEQMLEQYEKASGGLIRLKVIDPKPDSPEEERAIAAGLNGTEIQNGDRVFLGMVVAQGETETVQPFFNWDRETFLEYDISKTIYETQLITKPRLGLITSLPLKAPPAMPMPGQPQQQSDQIILTQLETQFEIVEVQGSESELPADLDLLALIHPKNLSEDLQYSIDQYALSGKPVFLSLDPSSVMEREQGRQQMMMGQMSQPTPSDLPNLLSAWGIEYDVANVLTDPTNSLSQGRFTQPSWLIFRNDFVNRDLLPSSELEGVLLLEAGQLKHSSDATTSWEPILTTSADAGQIESMMLQFTDPSQIGRQAEPLAEPATVAGLLTGTASTAFPDREDENKKTSGDITVFIIADSDFLLDQFSVQRVNFLGMQQVQKLNDNQDLANNFIEYLGGSRDLIGIRGKAGASRPFDVVLRMEAEAQKQYQAKLEVVEAELQETNQKLSEILSEQTGSGIIYATPEMEELIAENQKKQAELKSQIREIRSGLRQGIDTLGNTIGAINLLWAPLALLAFALIFNRMRKSN
ncbi:GldG family protein [Pelagicoccus sp. SDUM812002]|uniref:GldG family protein n=1 Tax=Pelagicoccus sp. SDUM812002 TaxID=3041266 RepID=UPI0028108A7C|nr:GldG family protein [Pelagicoccus sp. SDUM812002]MDQ8186986.1 GldG family protein [Pelagicoccus sp. SDUM812002]